MMTAIREMELHKRENCACNPLQSFQTVSARSTPIFNEI
jgi:hypothetical protein